MGYSIKIQRKEQERILSKSNKIDRVKESFKVAKETVTDPISNAIKKDQEALYDAIMNLNKRDRDYSNKKMQLKRILINIPLQYRIKKETVIDVQDQINKILGENKSN